MKPAKPTRRGFRRDGPWPLVLFVAVMLVTLSVQFAWESLGRAMGLSCNVGAVIEDTPAFAGIASVLLLFALISWGPGRAFRAIGYAWSLHIVNAGLITLIIHGVSGCHLGHSSWLLIAAGALLFVIVRFLSKTAHRSEEK